MGVGSWIWVHRPPRVSSEVKKIGFFLCTVARKAPYSLPVIQVKVWNPDLAWVQPHDANAIKVIWVVLQPFVRHGFSYFVLWMQLSLLPLVVPHHTQPNTALEYALVVNVHAHEGQAKGNVGWFLSHRIDVSVVVLSGQVFQQAGQVRSGGTGLSHSQGQGQNNDTLHCQLKTDGPCSRGLGLYKFVDN